MSNKVTFKPDHKAAAKLEAMLAAIPKQLQGKGGPVDEAVQVGAEIGRKAMAAEAPDSDRTGSRDKQSRKSKGIWTAKLKEQIGVRMRYYPRPVAIIGNKHPYGNMAHFLQTRRRKHVLWGRASAVRGYRMARNWGRKALADASSQVNHAMRVILKSEIAAMMRKAK